MLGSVRFKEWRESRALTQAQVADLLGVRQSRVSEWESGRTQPRVRMAVAIARVTGGEVPVELWADATEPAASSEQEAPAPHEPATEAP